MTTDMQCLPSFFWQFLSSGAECIQELPVFHTRIHLACGPRQKQYIQCSGMWSYVKLVLKVVQHFFFYDRV